MKRVYFAFIFILLTGIFTSAGGTGFTPKAEARAADEQPRYALLVGITDYKSTSLNRIDGCENNVPLLAQTLIDSYGFKKGDVRILTNGQASKAEILREFKTHLIDNARKVKEQGKEAVVVYYFCGHGSQYRDQDGDENDGLDETFVAYDSRIGATPDILDDEIDDLKAELRPLTTNTTLILESCHSGTGTRGDEGDKEFISEEADADKKAYPPFKRKFKPTGDDDAFTYTEIAASASANTAKSESREYCNCDKPYSLMTKALVEALSRANYSTTYRSLGREISSVVAERSRQDPQVEGNRDTLLFGGAAKRKKPYIEIERLQPDGEAIIRAGSVHGLKVGSQVAIYDAASTTDSGDADWLTNGVVTAVRNFQSVVKLPPTRDNPKVGKVTVSSHVVLTSPVFGGGPVLVALDTVTAASRTASDASLVAQVHEQLKASRVIDDQSVTIVPSGKLTPASLKTARGVVRLRKDKFAAAFPARIRALARLPKPTVCMTKDGGVTFEMVPEIRPDTEGYFLDDGSAGGTPLYGRFFLTDDRSAAPEIARLIRNYALRANLVSLNNNASTLPSEISVSVSKISNVEMVENCVGGRIEKGLKTRPKPSDFLAVKNGRIPFGSIFDIKVKNISGDVKRKKDPFAAGEPLHVTAIYLLNNGDIEVAYPRLGANDPLGDGVEKTVSRYLASTPGGAEHLILIVSKKFIDLSFYESVTVNRDARSPLERLLKQSGTKTRDAGTLIADEPDEWGVVRVDLEIGD